MGHNFRTSFLPLAFLGAVACSEPAETSVAEDQVVYLPDLVVTQVEGPLSARPNDSFIVTNTICNQGNDPASSSNARLVLSTDDTIDGTDTWLTTRSVPWLAPGECNTDATWVPGLNPPMGGYYVGVIADEAAQIIESDEGNNTGAGAQMGIGNGPDIVIGAIDAPPSADGWFEIDVLVCNNGTDPASGIDITVYLSADDTIETYTQNPMSPDFMFGNGWASWMQPGACTSVTVSGSNPGWTGAHYVGAVADETNSTVELIETNNTTVGDLIGLGNGPDFIITAIDTPAVTDGPFNASVRVCNQGTAPASSTDVTVYLSQDTTIEGTFQNPMTPDLPAGFVSFNFLSPGACATQIGNLWAPSGLNAPYVGGIVDESGSAAELIESNNVFVGNRMGVGYGPDLRIARIEGPPNAEGNIDLTVEACNDGNAMASSVDVHLYASQDTTIVGYYNSTFFDPPLGVASFPSLMPSQCQTTVVSSFVPVLGPHYIGGIIDEPGFVAELNEFNNVFVGALTGFGYGADIIVAAIDAPPSADGSFDMDITVCNQGTAPASGTNVDIYISQDTTITPGFMGPDFLAATVNTSFLNAGQCETINRQAPTAGFFGAFYLGAVADPYDSLTELLESNNVFVGGLIGLGNGPDLIATAITAPPSADGPFNATVTVCNQGTAPVSNADVTLVLSEDQVLETFASNPTPADIPCSSMNVPFLAPGQCGDVTMSCNAFSAPPHYIGAVVDDFGSVTELIESNNHFVGPQIGMGYGPDIIVSNIAAPPSADGLFEAQITACNQGTAPSGSFDVQVYLSEDQQIEGFFMGPTSPDVPFGAAWFPNLMPMQCATQAVSGGAPAVQAAWYIGAIADEWSSLSELIETNNTFVGGPIGLGYGPDLIVTAVTGPPSVDGNATIDTTVCNQGTAPASGVMATIYLSQDNVLVTMSESPTNSDWPLVPGVWMGDLAAGQCNTVSSMAWFPPGPSPQYLAGAVDEYESTQELNENNNELVDGLIGVGMGPDFIVTSVGGPPSANGGFNVAYTVCNQGTLAGSADVNFYVSEDQTLTTMFESPSTPDQPIGGASHTLAAGACVTGSHPVAASGQGAYYLAASVDEFLSVVELREDNNETIGDRIGLGNGPDLIVETLTGPPSANGGFTIDFTVCNQGTSVSPPTDINFYASASPEVLGSLANPWAPPLIGAEAISSLAAGACVSGAANVFAPGMGPYYLGAIVDEWDGVLELIEDNNTLLGPQIGLGLGPDLVVNVVSGPPLAAPGSTMNVDMTVCNQGTDSSPSVDVVAYLSTDQTITMSDALLNGTTVSALPAGQCASVSVPAPAYLPEGTYYFGAIVDEYDSISELIETNNTTLGNSVQITQVFCGNGLIDQVPEECDDGNFVDGDGCSSQCFIEHHVWQENASGSVYLGPNAWNYAMGFHFTPSRDGQIIELGGFFHGTKTVKLFDRATGALLAETTATANAATGQWGYGSIPAVAVTAGTDYTVAVYLAGSGGTYRRPSPRFPQTFGDITIHGTTWTHTGSDPDRIPTNTNGYYMFGQADVTFVLGL